MEANNEIQGTQEGRLFIEAGNALQHAKSKIATYLKVSNKTILEDLEGHRSERSEEEKKEERRTYRLDLVVIFVFNLFSGISTGLAVYKLTDHLDDSLRVWVGIAAAIVGTFFSFVIERTFIHPMTIRKVYKSSQAQVAALGILLFFYLVIVFSLSTVTSVIWIGGEAAGNMEIEKIIKQANNELVEVDRALKMESSFMVVAEGLIDQYKSLEESAERGDFTEVSGRGKLTRTFAIIRKQFEDFILRLRGKQGDIDIFRVKANKLVIEMKEISLDNTTSVKERVVLLNPILNEFNSVMVNMRSMSMNSNLTMMSNNLGNFITQYGLDGGIEEEQRRVLSETERIIFITKGILESTAKETRVKDFNPQKISNIFEATVVFSQFGNIFVFWFLMIAVDVAGLFIFFRRLVLYRKGGE